MPASSAALVGKIPSVPSHKPVDRTPRSPRLSAAAALEELHGAQVLDAMVDDSALQDVALINGQRREGLVAPGVDLKRFVTAGVDLSGATLDGLRSATAGSVAAVWPTSARTGARSSASRFDNARLTGAIFTEPRIIERLGSECTDRQGLRELAVNGSTQSPRLATEPAAGWGWDMDWRRLDANQVVAPESSHPPTPSSCPRPARLRPCCPPQLEGRMTTRTPSLANYVEGRVVMRPSEP
jgi:hypothetical protein